MTKAWVNPLPAETLGQLVVHGGLPSMTAASGDFSSAPVASDFPTGHRRPDDGPAG
jgi:hypothetical protein